MAPVELQAVTGSKPKKVFVLGGDGFCGWPTAVHLSDKGHEVIIIDNLSRRKIDVELGCESLTPISSPEVRVKVWNEISGKRMRFEYMDIAAEYDRFLQLIKDEKPDTMVHFAEQVTRILSRKCIAGRSMTPHPFSAQRAAPYSMKNSATKRYTVDNNLGATHNTLCTTLGSNCVEPVAWQFKVTCLTRILHRRHRRERRRRAPRSLRNDGGIRLWQLGRADPGGLHRRHPARRPGAQHPAPCVSWLSLPHNQMPRCAALPGTDAPHTR